MDQGPLVGAKIEAGARFLAELEKELPVQAAIWLKPDEQSWQLFVASDQVSEENATLAYRKVGKAAETVRDPNLSPFEVTLIGASDPVARAALEIHHRYPGRPAHFHDRSFGGMSVEEAYVYPSPLAVS